MSKPLSIVKVAVFVPLRKTFDYLNNKVLSEKHIGCRVMVPFGASKRLGVILSIEQQSYFDIEKLKPVSDLLDVKPLLSQSIIKLALWSAAYYQYPIGEVFEQLFPGLLRKPGYSWQLNKTIWHLANETPNDALENLQRAPRQQQVFSFIQQSNHQQCDEEQLSMFDFNWKKTLLELQKKSLVISKQQTHQRVFASEQITENICQLPLKLNQQQQQAVDEVLAQQSFYPLLLFGVTGSGKTEVYLQIMAQHIAQGNQVLILVPEINLTPQLFARFRKRFALTMSILHSGLNDKQRLNDWMLAQRGITQIVIATRSSVFIPLPKLSLIIVDEEHDLSFKQQEGFRYQARDIAMMRAMREDIPIVLGSATPSFESLCNVEQKKYHCCYLNHRAANSLPPKIELLDARGRQIEHGISEQVIEQIQQELILGNQIIVFQNRRGFSPTTFCHQCGWVAKCVNCDASLTYHHKRNILICHHCDSHFEVPKFCMSCQGDQIEHIGAGTERIENTLAQLFPNTQIARIDRDTIRAKDAFDQMLERIHRGEVQILVGTQMLAKGHHFPNVTLVVILDVDQALFSYDFRALERVAQLILQVSGRAGRGDKPGRVILQTHQPQHPFYYQLLQQGYQGFAQQSLFERQQMQIPPYAHYALIRAEAKDKSRVFEFLNQLFTLGQSLLSEDIMIYPPIEAPMQRKVGKFRGQLLIQSQKRQALQQFFSHFTAHADDIYRKQKLNYLLRWSIDIDAQDMS